MAKAVLISIRPEWAKKILAGEKTLEVRKTRPKLETPFKCYIYCTSGNLNYEVSNGMMCNISGGKLVVGEFVCDRIDTIIPAPEPYGLYDVDDDFVAHTCLTNGALWDYGKGATLYGWHISKLEIYDMPKQINRFKPWNRECKYNHLGLAIPKCDGCHDCTVEKPPQSWCYVEELINGQS